MRRLILFRHAKAVRRASGGDDAARPLDPAGRIDASLSGRWMSARGIAPDVVLASPSARTLETWERVGRFFPDARLEVRDGLYDAQAEDIEAEIGTVAGEADVVLVIGHNPGVQELAVKLLSEGGAGASEVETVAAGFPTSTLALFEISADGRARMSSFFNPRRDAPPPFIETWDEGTDDAPGEGGDEGAGEPA
ncbi:MAG TPA: histidine phosphatase family protein [Caulobacteraceae bacterium]|jgi:phosphohistidine phosphatase|nr:histidine phosphatase family protein [Caulobacteraceae bacterium]